jgi:hypothetical protein
MNLEESGYAYGCFSLIGGGIAGIVRSVKNGRPELNRRLQAVGLRPVTRDHRGILA